MLVPRTGSSGCVCELRVQKRHQNHRAASVLVDSEVRSEPAANTCELRNRDTGGRVPCRFAETQPVLRERAAMYVGMLQPLAGHTLMREPKSEYVGDDAVKRLLRRYRCPAPFHVVRMRFWGAIASPSSEISMITIIQRLWSNGPPQFVDVR